jgi:hypothetical protein
MLIPKAPPPQTAPQAIAEMALPDLDTDGRPERMRIMPTDKPDQVLIRLDSSNGARTHDMLPVQGKGPMTFEKRGDYWLVMDQSESPIAKVQMYQNAKAKTPDLVVFAGDQGRRYVFIDRGFLKLDAHETIAGFSVGLVMMGDPAAALEAMGGPIGKDGAWSMPLAHPIPLKVQLDPEKKVSRITFASETLLSRQGFHVGVAAGELEKLVPGKRQADYWFSPRYGLIGHIGSDQRVESFSITAPWKDEQGKAQAPKP